MTARWRLAARIARREASRHRARSLLVLGLIALPVALLAAGVTLWATARQSPDEQAAATMGTADAVVELHDGASLGGLLDELGGTARAVPLDTSWPIGVRVGGERRELVLTGAPLDDPLTDGLIELVDGRAPSGVGEAAVTAALLTDLGAEIGEELELADLDATLTITGVVERPARLSASDVVVPPGTVPGQLDRRRWLVDAGPAPDRAIAPAMVASAEADTGDAATRGLTTRSEVSGYEPMDLEMLAVLGGLALTEAAIVASAAFAVGVRRQLRSLGLLAAAGGRRRDLRRVVLAGGLTLGSVGALLGACLGVAASVGMAPFLDGWLDRRVGALEIPWGLVAITALAGLTASVAAAAAPARTAGQVPVTAALAATRPLARPRRRLLAVGGAVVALGLVFIAGAAGNANRRMSDAPMITIVTVGAILVVLGFTFASPTIAGLLGRLADRAPTGARLALRDLARHRVRTGPAISAVMAALALPIAVGMFLASSQAHIAEGRRGLLAPEHVVVEAKAEDEIPAPDPERVDAIAEAVGASARVTLTELRSGPGTMDPAAPSVVVSATVEPTVPGGPGDRGGPLAVVDDVPAALDAWGVDEDERPAAAEALEDGAIVLFGVESVHSSGAVVRVDGEAVDRRRVVGVSTPPYRQLPWAVSTEAFADDLGLQPKRQRVLLRAEKALDQDARAAAIAAAGLSGRPSASAAGAGEAVDLRLPPPSRPALGMGLRWMALGVSAAVAGGIVVVALALSAAEARAERATLAAVGADRAMRRRFRAAQALALTLAAGVLALPAGLLPAVVTLVTRQPSYPLRLPWEALGAALVGLPVLAWAAVRVLSREHDETRPATR